MNEFVEGMRAAGKLAAETLTYVKGFVLAGITTNQLDKIAYDFIVSNGATPAPLNYKGYPKSICTSVNYTICHGVPNDVPLKDGDYINVDVTVNLNGYFGDTSISMIVGRPDDRLIETARKATAAGIKAISPNGTVGDIGFAINKTTIRAGFYAVQDIGGHGIGKVFHDAPFVPSFGKKNKGLVLKPWTCITVEPLIIERNEKLESHDIEGCEIWEHSANGSMSAQFEHTVLITDTGYEVLT